MQRPAWKLLLFFSLLLILVMSSGVALAQESASTAQASATPYNPAAAFATPAARSSSSSVHSEGPDPDLKWEIEFHGGGILSTNPDGGKSALPPPGVPFITEGTLTSRAISSYYFGDGALLYNQFIAAAGPLCPSCTPIVPLDPVLTTRTAERANGGAFGFRASRDITPRWAIEVNFDFNLGQMELTSPALAGIEATRASWSAAFANLAASVPGFTGVSSTSVSTVRATEGHQIFGTAGVNVNLLTEGRLIPYVSFGGGALANTGDLPSALLVGNFQFTDAGAPHNNTDTVLVNWELPGVQGVGYFGGGFKYYVTSRWGFRFDVRDYLSGNGLRQAVSATPLVATLAPAQATNAGVQPDLQFSNDPPSGRDTLSGPVLTRFRTFTGDGIRHQIAVSGGVFFRF